MCNQEFHVYIAESATIPKDNVCPAADAVRLADGILRRILDVDMDSARTVGGGKVLLGMRWVTTIHI